MRFLFFAAPFALVYALVKIIIALVMVLWYSLRLVLRVGDLAAAHGRNLVTSALKPKN